MIDWRKVDWRDPRDGISLFFTVKEALWLNKWSRMAYEGDGLDANAKEQICILADRLDQVRASIAQPMHVHSWFRPKGYNALIGGSSGSKHMCLGQWSAVDFHCDLPGEKSVSGSCATVRAWLEYKLERFGLRMEDLDGPWVHLDSAPVGKNRFFKPR